ncbi:MAG TPA: DUF2997 domain-containing protein [Campylobacterales bacterium]|nr:DUF2997 domain-containing protein [Campylobacterales bacterium]
MKTYTIEIEIDEDGNIRAETKGMEGKVCVSELDEVLAGLGKEEQVKNKPEYYKNQKVAQRQRVRK